MYAKLARLRLKEAMKDEIPTDFSTAEFIEAALALTLHFVSPYR